MAHVEGRNVKALDAGRRGDEAAELTPRALAGMFASSAWRATAESAAGSVAAAEGERDGAAEHFATAASLYAAAGQPYWAERSAADASSARER